MKNEKTLKRLQSTSKLSGAIGYIFIALCVLCAVIGLFDLFSGEELLTVSISFGSALGMLGIGAILLTISAIAEYHTHEN